MESNSQRVGLSPNLKTDTTCPNGCQIYNRPGSAVCFLLRLVLKGSVGNVPLSLP